MSATLSDAELERYARHIVLHPIGGQGQLKLKSATVTVVGAGGLGSPCLLYLAAAGVGTLRILDDDAVSLSNLQRQILHGTQDIGHLKTDSAQTALARINPHVEIQTHALRLSAENAESLLAGSDVVADGSDNFTTRLIVADMCQKLHIPLVSAAVGSFDGQLAVFRGWEQDKPCYRCFVGADPQLAERSCADQGIMGALTGMMGSMQALEVIREITGFSASRAGRLWLYDALGGHMRDIALPKDEQCPSCAPI